ncbi:MAG: 16S rRNA processing protein RimM [Clostridia bacterium]|nr:16S rRNA processing protein RimM [Clostridia bacterium]
MEDLLIGEILKPQGIKGELKVKPFTDTPFDIKKFGAVYIDGAAYKILSFRENAGVAYLGLRGVPDRNAAELLRGKKLYGKREDAPDLEEGRYYIVDIIGLACETEEGEHLGTVTDVSLLSSDVYTIEKEGKKVLFPAVKGVVKKVDLTAKKLIVDKAVFDEIAVY